VDYLLSRDEVIGETLGVVGFCMGGAFALQLAVQEGGKVASVVAFYPTGYLPDGYSGIQAPVLIHIPDGDAINPSTVAQELIEKISAGSGINPEIDHYPAGHAFLNEEDRLGTYDAQQARIARDRTLAFLGAHLPKGDVDEQDRLEPQVELISVRTMNSMARRMFELVEPIGVIPYSADEPNDAMFALGFTDYWDTYFAGRAAPLGLAAAEVVDALFYNFAPGEVARHIPKVWRTTTPESAIAARQMGCAKALRRILGDRVDSPTFARATELLINAATSVPYEGRPMYAALRSIQIPDDVVVRLFHAASLLREHRGDGHIAALMIEGVGGLEAHVLFALDMDLPAEKFGRVHHLPAAQLATVIDGMRDRGLIGEDGWLTDQGRAVKQRVESLTDDLAAKPYEILEPVELHELMDTLEPLATLLLAAQD
jgi:Dienelactone hydrolase family